MGHALSPSDAEAPDESKIGCTLAPIDVPKVLKTVETLFPKGAPRESYPSHVALEVRLLQISKLKLAAKRLGSGKVLGPDGILNEVLRATIREKPQLILDLFNTCWKEAIFRNNGNARNWF